MSENTKKNFEVKPYTKEEFFTLKNENISVRFTSKGGAISDVEILKYLATQDAKDPYTFNKVKGALPAMTMAFFDSSSDLPAPVQANFALTAKSDEAVTYEYTQAGKFKISRTYALIQTGKNDFTKYTIASKTKIENISDKPLSLEEVYFCIGAVPPTESDVYGSNLAFLMYGLIKGSPIRKNHSWRLHLGFGKKPILCISVHT